MNQENTRKLIKRFPVLYQDCGIRSPRVSCMYFGFECGDGWFDLLWMLSLAIEEELGYSWYQSKVFLFKNWLSRWWNAYGWGNVWFPYTGFRAAQVKEKFGTLRFYTAGGEFDDKIFEFVSLAERLSATTCERCGSYGTERGPGWIQTLCDDCVGGK